MPDSPTLRSALLAASDKLAAISDSPRLDAELLLCHVLQVNRSHLLAWPEKQLDPIQEKTFVELTTRRQRGEPVAYLIGEQEFWSLTLKVTPATLIPRPETETLVEQALQHLPADTRVKVADLGTGSGAIALAIASERPLAEVYAVDMSHEALAVAQANARQHDLTNVHFAQSHWLDGIGETDFDMICSNPPYVAPGDPHLTLDSLPFEPQSALVATEEGLADLRYIIEQSQHHLKKGGWLLLEHGWDQAARVRTMMQGPYNRIHSVKDLAGIERITLGCLAR